MPILLWSKKHSRWWRENADGYTPEVVEAGHYTAEEARRRAGPDSRSIAIDVTEYEAECLKRAGQIARDNIFKRRDAIVDAEDFGPDARFGVTEDEGAYKDDGDDSEDDDDPVTL
jgi:hypothetical protein